MSVYLEVSFNLQTSASLEVSIIWNYLIRWILLRWGKRLRLSMRKGRCGRKIILVVRIVDVIFVGRGFESPSHSSQQKQVERRAAEDAVPLQRPHLRGQDWGPEAVLHQGSLPSSYNGDHHMFNIAPISSIIMTLYSPERRVGPDDEEPLWRLQGQHWQDPWRV